MSAKSCGLLPVTQRRATVQISALRTAHRPHLLACIRRSKIQRLCCGPAMVC